jgi:hypothetical protein
MRQSALGENSYWKPYLDLMPEVSFFCEQDSKAILAAHDSQLLFETVEYRKELGKVWQSIEPILQTNVHLFNEKLVTKQMFNSFFC